MTAPALEAMDLCKAFGGVRAVDDVGVRIGAGEIVALIGPNGAGKTTLFNMLGGQLRPDAGRITLFGRDVTGLPPRRLWRLGVGRTFQITATFTSMTLRQNVQAALISHHRRAWSPWTRAERLYREEADGLLSLVGMADLAERAVAGLAYGDLKRLDLAIALAHDPRVLLMDEPTAGMAPGERAHLMDLTVSVSRSRGVAVVFTEHDMEVVFGHAERVLVMDRGRLVAEGPPAAIRADARVRAIYLGETGADAEAST
ncbi:ABC transporter ATP-binding protein [Rhodospira trueperi]|uniref:Branched-chain amino acid transport system ATP-binding protein n=1 Tax=Rhodospira trueperi TaxID=69960 RepID=A0A1G6XRB8_9PROT|nr:ABC transporter ATP-binding protein [Rhodospira trueperi]SDD79866.1 branched-chain amino acid transport system ATP-binding protein [Rhodospira trueperi]